MTHKLGRWVGGAGQGRCEDVHKRHCWSKVGFVRCLWGQRGCEGCIRGTDQGGCMGDVAWVDKGARSAQGVSSRLERVYKRKKLWRVQESAQVAPCRSGTLSGDTVQVRVYMDA